MRHQTEERKSAARPRAWRGGGVCSVWAVVIVALSTVPTLAGYLYAPEGTIFTGNARFTLDYNTYLSFIFQAGEGHLLFQEMYWPWPNPSLLLQPLFLLLGLICRLTGLSLVAAHEAGRILFGLLLLLVLYHFISLVFERGFERTVAFILASLGGGLAWAYPWINPGNIPVEQHYLTGWVEANTFLSILAFPLFSSSLLLMVLTFTILLRLLEKGGIARCVLLGLTAALLSLNHPYDLFIIACVGGAYLALSLFLFRDRFGLKRILQGICTLAVSLSAVAVYHYAATGANPAFSYWSRNMHDPSPPLLWVAANFGIIGPMAIVGLAGVIARGGRNHRLVFLSVWGVVGLLIIYLPCNFQRRLIEGLPIPLSLLAAHALFWPTAAKKKMQRRLALLLILASIPGNVMTVVWTVEQLKENRGRLSPFITAGERDALGWLRENTESGAAVLAGYRMSNFIPAFSGNHVFWGRWVNEADFARRHALVRAFFSPATDDGFRLEFVRKHNIRYLFRDSDLVGGGQADPGNMTFLVPAYSNGEVAVFRVVDPASPRSTRSSSVYRRPRA